MGSPRSSSNAILKTDLHPLFFGIFFPTPQTGCTGASSYNMISYLVKFKHGEPDMYLVPLALGQGYPTYLYFAFVKSATSSTNKMISGNDDGYVGMVQTYIDINCNGNSKTTIY